MERAEDHAVKVLPWSVRLTVTARTGRTMTSSERWGTSACEGRSSGTHVFSSTLT